MNEESEREYVGREFNEFGSIDVYTVNGVSYFIPKISLREVHRLSKLDEQLTESQRKELSDKLNKMHEQLKTILQN